MVKLLVLACIVAGCGGGDSESPDAATGSPFLGTWSIITFDGTPQTVFIAWSFGPTEVSVSTSFSGTYTFDPRATPSRIDVAIAGATPNPNAAIYRFDAPTRL